MLVASTAEVEPPNLPLEITSTNQLIEISPLLINSGDSFAIHCVLSNPIASLSVEARIAGIKAITKLDVDEKGRALSMAALTLKKLQAVIVALALFATVSASVDVFYKGLDNLLNKVGISYQKNVR